MSRETHYEDVPCLPGCDERHADDCPREKAEMEHYRWYFAVGTPAFWNFKPHDCLCEKGSRNQECPRHG
jgi:hypothetical protein